MRLIVSANIGIYYWSKQSWRSDGLTTSDRCPLAMAITVTGETYVAYKGHWSRWRGVRVWYTSWPTRWRVICLDNTWWHLSAGREDGWQSGPYRRVTKSECDRWRLGVAICHPVVCHTQRDNANLSLWHLQKTGNPCFVTPEAKWTCIFVA